MSDYTPLLRQVEKLGPVRLKQGEFAPNRAQAVLVAQHSFMLGYAEIYGAQGGVVTESHADELANGVQMGVMQDCPGVLRSDWYTADLRQLAVDAMRLVSDDGSPVRDGSGT